MNDKLFRHELKYLLSPAQSMMMRSRLNAVVPFDKHAKEGGYRVTSVYLDDAYGTAYNDKMAGLSRRKKFRLRCYDLNPDFIRLEAKNKEMDVGWKDSAKLTLEQYHSILNGDFSFCKEAEFEGTAAEQLYYSNALVRLRPSVVVDYQREAYVYGPGNVRICFDSALSVLWNSTDMFASDGVYMKVPGNSVIFELKYDRFLPGVIQSLVSDLPAMRESVSKFTICTDFLSEGTKKCTF